MPIHKIKTADLAMHLQKMQAVSNKNEYVSFETGLHETQPLTKSIIPCGFKVTAVRNDGVRNDDSGAQIAGAQIANAQIAGAQMVTCGNQNTSLGTTDLCDACHAIFKNVFDHNDHSVTMEQVEKCTNEKSPSLSKLSLFEKGKKFVEEHPFLAGAAISLPVICGILAYGFAPSPANATNNLLIGGETPTTPSTTTSSSTAPTTTMQPLTSSEAPTKAATTKRVTTTTPTTPITSTTSTTSTAATKPTTLSTTTTLSATTTLSTTSTTTAFTTTASTSRATTKPTTTTTKKAPPTKPQKPAAPNYAVTIKKASSPQDKDKVIVTTRVAAPRMSAKDKCYSATPVYSWNNDQYAGIKVKNDCARPLLITTAKMVAGGKIQATSQTCLVERGETQNCLGPLQSFANRFGVNVQLNVPSQANQNLTAQVTPEGELTVHLPTPKQVPLESGCIDVNVRGEHKVRCKNICDEPVLFSIVSNAETNSILLQPEKIHTVSVAQIPYLRENANLPEIIQKPEFT